MMALLPAQMPVLLLLLLVAVVFLGSVSGFGQVQHQFSTSKIISGAVRRDGEINFCILCLSYWVLFQTSPQRDI